MKIKMNFLKVLFHHFFLNYLRKFQGLMFIIFKFLIGLNLFDKTKTKIERTSFNLNKKFIF